MNDGQRSLFRLFLGSAIAVAFLSSATHLLAGKVTGYKPVIIPCSPVRGGAKLIALRRFYMDGGEKYVVVDGRSFRTAIAKADDLLFSASWPEVAVSAHDFPPYLAALGDATGRPYPVQNQGIRHFERNLDGAVVSVDLCPSKHPLVRSIFTDLIGSFQGRRRPVPVAIAVSAFWLKNHGRDLEWLRSLETAGKIDITWVNHSYSHPQVFRPRPWELSKGFLLGTNVDIEKEILKAEEIMIEEGLTPSVFVRFPGLVSNRKIVEKMRSWGLIPLGADAWLAKREVPRGGSIILVHGNGNEPAGVSRLRNLLSARRSRIERGTWKILDLRDCAAAMYGKRAFPAIKKQKFAGGSFPAMGYDKLPRIRISQSRRFFHIVASWNLLSHVVPRKPPVVVGPGVVFAVS